MSGRHGPSLPGDPPAKHTPAPWVVDRRDDHDVDAIDIISPSAKATVATVLGDDKLTDMERADARLIAAAPELLAAAKYAVECWRKDGKLTDVNADDLHDAVAKAEAA